MLSRPARRQSGIALLESLVSIAILATAVLALLGLQLRTLAEAQTAARRAHAVRLVEDLSERLKAHPEARDHLADYVSDWEALPDSADCRGAPCDASTLARWDIAQWKQAVARALPLGRATVFAPRGPATASERLGVLIAWRANEQAADDADLQRPFTIDTGGAGLRCPERMLCHLAHVQP